jgi:hypothetical protein
MSGNKAYFTLNEGEPIALIYDIKHNTNNEPDYLGISFIEPDTENDLEMELDLCSDLLNYNLSDRRQISDREQLVLEECLANRDPPIDKCLRKIYLECLERIEANMTSTFRIQTGVMQPLPTETEDQTDRLYVVGPSGSGKTTFISLWCVEYTNIFPDNKIVLFSRKLSDKNLDDVRGLTRIQLDDNFKEWLYKPQPQPEPPKKEPESKNIELEPEQTEKIVEIKEEPMITDISDEEEKEQKNCEPANSGSENYNARKLRRCEILRRNVEQEKKKNKTRKDFLDELEGSLCIFDDIDVIGDDFIREEVRKLRDDLLETGRDRDISVITTSHNINNYNLTKKAMNESTAIVLFPHAGGHTQVQKYLTNNMMLDKAQIKSIMSLQTRWLYIYKNSPRYIIHEHGAIFI